MKKYGFFIGILLSIAVIPGIFFSCAQEDVLEQNSEIEIQNPYGKWKLLGYASTDAKQVDLVSGLPAAYHLALNQDGTFTGTSSTNDIGGKYAYTSRGGFTFSSSDFFSTKINETEAGNLYLDRLLKVTDFRVYPLKKEMHLYYSDKEYLLYVKLDT